MKKIGKKIITIFVLMFTFIPVVFADVNCSTFLGNPNIKELIKEIYSIFKYLALTLTVGLGMLDFLKAITGNDAGDLKKSAEKFLKRIIAVVVLFLIPILIDFLLGIIGIKACLPD